jgi:hypothetical protein
MLRMGPIAERTKHLCREQSVTRELEFDRKTGCTLKSPVINYTEINGFCHIHACFLGAVRTEWLFEYYD